MLPNLPETHLTIWGGQAAGKALFYEQLEARLVQAYGEASKAITRNMLGEDAAEGVGAFIEKRKPNWQS